MFVYYSERFPGIGTVSGDIGGLAVGFGCCVWFFGFVHFCIECSCFPCREFDLLEIAGDPGWIVTSSDKVPLVFEDRS